MNRKVILLGEGIHQHTLYGKFESETHSNEIEVLTVEEDSELRHETPGRKPAEHKTLSIDKGMWVVGKQVEYNPFTREVSRVWD